jgi:hypothetical protein
MQRLPGTYQSIHEMLGKQKHPLTQVDILSQPNQNSPHITLTSQEDIACEILMRNKQCSKQSIAN